MPLIPVNGANLHCNVSNEQKDRQYYLLCHNIIQTIQNLSEQSLRVCSVLSFDDIWVSVGLRHLVEKL